MTESHVVIIESHDQSAAMGRSPSAASAGAQERPSAPLRARWLFVDGATSFGGHEVMLVRWLEELATQRAIDAFVLARSAQLRQQASGHATVIALPDANSTLKDAATFIRQAFDLKPELIVVAEGCLLAQAQFVALGRLLGIKVFVYVPLVQTATSMGFGSGRLRDAIVRRWYANLPHGWITLTREQASEFRAWAGVRRPVLVLPNTVARAIECAPIAKASEHPNRRLRVIVLGRIEAQQKGLDTLFDHLVHHRELGERIVLSFVGDGPYAAHIRERLANDAELARFVSLHAWSPALEVLRTHGVVLMTSRYEGVPLVMLEAMAVGVPVVAPNLPGTRGFVSRECLFEAGDISAAFACIEQLQSSATRAQVAERNRATFESVASNAAFAAAVKSITQELRALAQTSLRRRSA